MSQEDLRQTENEEQSSTLNEERESEDTSDFADLFSDEESEEMPTREEYNRLLKGTQKLATELGRLKKQSTQTEVKTEAKQEVRSASPEANPVLKNLYLKANPEAELIWDEVEKEAKMLGKDPFTLYENSSYFKGEAKARADAKSEDMSNISKIGKPSAGRAGTVSFESIDLSNKEHVKYLKEKGLRGKYADWYTGKR